MSLDMQLLVQKIKGIQNKRRTLLWGSVVHSETEVLFVVGSKAYPRQQNYFIINDNHEVLLIDDCHLKTIFAKCSDDQEVVATVIQLLKEWFPAKG
jgi:hypothetical protein